MYSKRERERASRRGEKERPGRESLGGAKGFFFFPSQPSSQLHFALWSPNQKLVTMVRWKPCPPRFSSLRRRLQRSSRRALSDRWREISRQRERKSSAAERDPPRPSTPTTTAANTSTESIAHPSLASSSRGLSILFHSIKRGDTRGHRDERTKQHKPPRARVMRRWMTLFARSGARSSRRSPFS